MMKTVLIVAGIGGIVLLLYLIRRPTAADAARSLLTTGSAAPLGAPAPVSTTPGDGGWRGAPPTTTPVLSKLPARVFSV